jgi:hypothetical protein
MIIVPEMIGSIVGVYNGKTFNQVEIKVRQLTNALLSILYQFVNLCTMHAAVRNVNFHVNSLK